MDASSHRWPRPYARGLQTKHKGLNVEKELVGGHNRAGRMVENGKGDSNCNMTYMCEIIKEQF